MINGLYNFFNDFSKLFYWLLLLTSWFLSADIVGVFFLKKSLEEIFSVIQISDIIMIFIFHTLFILTSLIIYKSLGLVRLAMPNVFIKDNNIDFQKGNYRYSEILNKAVRTNNQTMYNYYKDSKNENTSLKNQKYLCFATILLLILAVSLEDSYVRLAFENYNDDSWLKRIIISIIIIFDLLGLLVIFHENTDSDYTDIQKEEPLNK
ncbi:hypothetical protein [Chryseobacterium viscerum]|uniref:Uncharacterized protein n=1 Tax=Chryseobacterium viscerum TaxID=1037377 RepID=A0A316WRC7_9FLAO|nr:hypothetical protein [Chryseobacterium viscerum]KAB1230822.1 hypothetical protein F8D52_10540 [Chryseobacterium viscerum]PWN63964.1 hypothetical protein C1634_005035 [Chryseobacterium viscerum]